MVDNETLVIRTVADDLLEFVKKKGVATLHEAASELKISQELVEEIIEFFVQARILDWDYHFTTPTIVMHKGIEKKSRLKKKSIDESQYIAEEFLKEIEEAEKKKYVSPEEIAGIEKEKQSLLEKLKNAKKPEEKGIIELQSKEADVLKKVFSDIKKSAPLTIEKAHIDEKLASQLAQLVDERIKGQLSKQSLDKSIDKNLLNKLKDELLKKASRESLSEALKEQNFSDIIDEKLKKTTQDYFKSAKSSLKVEMVQPTGEKYTPKDVVHVHITGQTIKQLRALTELEKQKLDELINAVKGLSEKKEIGKADKKYIELLIYFLSLEHADASVHIDKIYSLTEGLEKLFMELKKDFREKSTDMQSQISAAKSFIEGKEPEKALQKYHRALDIEATLPDFFPKERKRLQNSITRLYVQLAEGFEYARSKNAEDASEKIIALIKNARDAKSSIDKNALVAGIAKGYNSIPPEMLHYKCRISRHLLNICRGIPQKEQDAERLKEVISKIKEIIKLIRSKDLRQSEQKYNGLWVYLSGIGAVDESYIKSIYKVTEELDKLFKETESEFMEKLSVLRKRTASIGMYMAYKEYENAVKIYSKALDTVASLPEFFYGEKKKLQRYMILLYIELSEKYEDIKNKKTQHIYKRLADALTGVIKSRAQKGIIIKEVVNLLMHVPSELFGHKCIIGKQLLKIYTK